METIRQSASIGPCRTMADFGGCPRRRFPSGRPADQGYWVSSGGLAKGGVSCWHAADELAKGTLAGTSDIDLFGYGKGVVDFATEVAHRALDVLMS